MGFTMVEFEKICVNCAHVKPRRGAYFCVLLKQKVTEKYKCKKFKPRTA